MAETGLQVVEKLNTSTNGEIVAAKKTTDVVTWYRTSASVLCH